MSATTNPAVPRRDSRRRVVAVAVVVTALAVVVAIAGSAGADDQPPVGTIQPTGLEPVPPYVSEAVPAQPVGPTGDPSSGPPEPELTQPANPNPDSSGLPTQLPRDDGPSLLAGQDADLGDPNHVSPPDLGDPNANGQDEPPDSGT